MTTSELLALLREELDDTVEPYGWTTSYLVNALNEAEEQAARRAYLLVTTSPASVCTFSVSVSQTVYGLHSKILQVRRVMLASSEVPLIQKTRDELDSVWAGWEEYTGTPEFFVAEEFGELRLVPEPVSAVTATMHVARLPMSALVTTGGSPEIPVQYHRDLLIWARRAAYRKKDSDAENFQLSVALENEFTAKFGPLPSALNERRRRAWPKKLKARPRDFGT